MSTLNESLSWNSLAETLRQGIPFTQPIGGSRGAQLVWAGKQDAMAIRLPCSPESSVPKVPLAHVHIRKVVAAGQSWLEIGAQGLQDLQPFHQLGVLCAKLFEAPGVTPEAAVLRALETWGELLERRPLLSPEAQLGLRGELLVLRALLQVRGLAAIDSWTAYNVTVPGRHDFRIDKMELEVKSTRQHKRRHWISSLRQLEPSPGFALFLISIQFEQAGAGHGLALPELVEAIRSLLTSARYRERFEQFLALALYRDSDAEFYEEKLILASEASVIPLADEVPQITLSFLKSVMSTAAMQRLVDVKYEIDLDGLGGGPGMPIYSTLFGNTKIG